MCAGALALALVPRRMAQNKIKVAAVYTVPIEQQWVSRIHKALNAAKDRGEIEYVFSEKVANADYERVMREYAEKGNTFIVGESFAVEPAARKVAKDYPKVSFLMGSSGKPQAPNFAVFDNYIQEPAYLTGMVAGGMTKTNKIGMVGGYPDSRSEPPDARVHGGRQGRRIPKVEFYVTFIGSWFDPPKAKEAAFAMIEKGADVMYAERFGVSDAAKERGKLAIGNVIDTQAQYPDTVVVSALWNMEPTIDTRARRTSRRGKFKAEDYGQYSTMKHKGTEMSKSARSTPRCRRTCKAKVAAKEKDILDGKFKVPVVETEPKSTAK